MADEFESWQAGSNLKENWDGTVKAVTFEKGENNSNWSAHFEWTADDGDQVEAFYGLGSDWESYDGGASVEHPKGAHTKFNAQTAYSELLLFSVAGCEGDVDDQNTKPIRVTADNADSVLGCLKVFRPIDRAANGRAAQIGASWVGMRFHMDVYTRPARSRTVTKNEDGSETVEWKDTTIQRMLPTRFLGMAATQQQLTEQPAPDPATVVSVASGPSPQTVESAGSSPAGTNTAQPSHPALTDLSEKDRSSVVNLAKRMAFGDFVDSVMELTTESGTPMLNVPSVMQALGNEDLYNALRG